MLRPMSSNAWRRSLGLLRSGCLIQVKSNGLFPTTLGSAVQTKGLGSAFVSATKRLIATCRSTTDRNTPRLRRRRVSLEKKPSTALSGCGGRGEVERPAGMPGQPLAHLRMLVGRIVVDDGVDHFSHGNLLLDRVEEADKLLMAVALHVAADDSAVKDVEGCEADQGADFIKSCFAGGKSARKA